MAPNQKTSGKATQQGVVGPQTFRSVIAVIVWWVWVAFAVANLIDLAVQGRDHLSVVAAAILLMVTGVAYVTAERPRVIAADDGITIRNPLRDHRVPWALVAKVDLADLLRVHCRQPGAADTGAGKKSEKVISAWAVHYSRRRQMTSDLRARRATARASRGGLGRTTPFGVPEPGYARRPVSATDNSPEAEAERIARLLNDRATAAGIEQATAVADQPTTAEHQALDEQPATGSVQRNGRLVSTWSWQALAALGVPALILLIVALA